MSTNYPDSFDVFGVPSLPEETPLSSAGDSTRNHTELLRDVGDAVEAIEVNAALKGHDHSGDAADIHKGAKLAQANTHQSPDTDSGSGSLHHTLGTGSNQAAPGNHVHTYASLTGKPIVACTSATRPASPTLGLLIYETDTYRLRTWAQYPGDLAPSWRYLLGPLPNVRLRQAVRQKIINSGTILNWGEEVEDSFNMFNAGTSATNVICRESGLYQIECALQWDADIVPDIATVALVLNGVETTIRQQQYLRGGGFNPGFSQTLTLAGKLRMNVNDVLTVKAKYTAPGGILNFIFSFFDDPAQIKSRLDVSYLGP